MPWIITRKFDIFSLVFHQHIKGDFMYKKTWALLALLLGHNTVASNDAQQEKEFFRAVKSHNVAALQDFIEHKGMDPHLRDEHNNTVLHVAVLRRNLGAVRYLTQLKNSDGTNKINPNLKGDHGKTPLHLLAAYTPDLPATPPFQCRDNLAIMIALFQAGADANVLNTSNESPLFHAAKHERFDLIECLLRNGANPMQLPLSHRTAVLALLLKNTPTVAALFVIAEQIHLQKILESLTQETQQ
jgi:ankyrin repeat protein